VQLNPKWVCTIKLVYQSVENLFVDLGFWWGLLEFGLSSLWTDLNLIGKPRWCAGMTCEL
jgi:hypothetical protein